MNTQEIIYSITIEDICNVAEEVLNRDLTEKEIRLISNKVGDYVDWREAIEFAISDWLIKGEIKSL